MALKLTKLNKIYQKRSLFNHCRLAVIDTCVVSVAHVIDVSATNNITHAHSCT